LVPFCAVVFCQYVLTLLGALCIQDGVVGAILEGHDNLKESLLVLVVPVSISVRVHGCIGSNDIIDQVLADKAQYIQSSGEDATAYFAKTSKKGKGRDKDKDHKQIMRLQTGHMNVLKDQMLTYPPPWMRLPVPVHLHLSTSSDVS
jgi:hypothetical protein